MKKTVLLVGCGDVALRTVPLIHEKYRVFGLFRHPEKSARVPFVWRRTDCRRS